MGTCVEMISRLRTLSAALAAVALLASCGNDPEAQESKDAVKLAKQVVKQLSHIGQKSSAPDPAAVAEARRALEASGLPVIFVDVLKLRYRNPMAPYGENGSVRTWASNSYETVSTRDDILVATRGLGPDLMSAVAPSLAEVRSGTGFFHRVYYYLDGADQPVRIDYDCDFAAMGAEAIEVMGKGYTTRKVAESCSNPTASFQNTYWFDGSGKLRQSDQFVSPLAGTAHIQRIAD